MPGERGRSDKSVGSTSSSYGYDYEDEASSASDEGSSTAVNMNCCHGEGDGDIVVCWHAAAVLRELAQHQMNFASLCGQRPLSTRLFIAMLTLMKHSNHYQTRACVAQVIFSLTQFDKAFVAKRCTVQHSIEPDEPGLSAMLGGRYAKLDPNYSKPDVPSTKGQNRSLAQALSQRAAEQIEMVLPEPYPTTTQRHAIKGALMVHLDCQITYALYEPEESAIPPP
jgi:hypothetical protein